MIGWTKVQRHTNVKEALIGADRYETNGMINERLQKKTHTIFVSAHQYADAASASNYLPYEGNQIHLEDGTLDLNHLEPSTRECMTVLGGPSSVRVQKA